RTESYDPRTCVESPSRGRVSTPAGVAPEALEESLCSSKGYKCCPTGLPHRGGRPASFFSRQRHSFSHPRPSPCWYSDPAFSLTIRGAYVNSGGFGYTRGASQLTVVDLFEGAV